MEGEVQMAIVASDCVEAAVAVPSSGSRLQSIAEEESRVQVRGKFFFSGERKFYGRGVTYGTFRPGADGNDHWDRHSVERDFSMMAKNGVTAVRLYTVPPRWLLDSAGAHGLRVLVGLAWEQHVAFLDSRRLANAIEVRLRAQVQACAGHPALFAYAVGNEIPASIVRWHGRARIERFLERLYHATKAEDPEALVTYVNYPSTEYLQLPFLDFVAFNVYLEARTNLEKYLARLQNIAGDRPLVLAELGMDSRRNGEHKQASSLDWQVRSAFAGGCAASFVFAWTDEWHRGGHEIEDWDFGLTDRKRRPKPALASVSAAFRDVPFSDASHWPLISVVVCTYNGERTLRDCLEGLTALRYPNYEVIIVNDGSTDGTLAITREFSFRVISTPNMGLSSARNTGLSAANGEIVAYIDDDAYPDPDWLTYLASTFSSTEHVSVGGPNLAPAGDGWIADAVANAPGGPCHVLLSDDEAEHIPGCNMAFRKSALQAVGGFDPRFRVAGDDVHVCWLLAERGWTLGFNPAALVWHHRRNSVRAYFRQQKGYGKAEALRGIAQPTHLPSLLENRWPEKYNTLGHLSWGGRVYGKGALHFLSWRRPRVYGGTWGSALFQSLYEPAPGVVSSLSLLPEWYFVIGALAAFTALAPLWRPLLALSIPLAISVLLTLVQAMRGAARASFSSRPATRFQKFKLYSLTTFLFLLQPFARLWGRLVHGLTPWRHAVRALAAPWPRTVAIWSEEWRALEDRLVALEQALRSAGVRARRGGDFDGWDLEVQSGLFGSARLQMAIEEHGAGKQLIRVRLWPRFHALTLVVVLPMGFLALAALSDHAWSAAAACTLMAAVLSLRALLECAAATGVARDSAHATRNDGSLMVCILRDFEGK